MKSEEFKTWLAAGVSVSGEGIDKETAGAEAGREELRQGRAAKEDRVIGVNRFELKMKALEGALKSFESEIVGVSRGFVTAVQGVIPTVKETERNMKALSDALAKLEPKGKGPK